MVLLVNIFKMQPKELCIQILVVISLAKITFGNPAVEIMNFQRAMIAPDGTCNADGCNIFCARGDDSFLYSDIQLAQNKKNVECREINELQLKRYDFHDKTIPHNWNPVVLRIRKLRIKSSDIEIIKFGAFQQYDFTELVLDNLSLQRLDNGTLIGLTTLKSLTVIQEKPIQYIPRDLLKPVQFNLVELQFSAALTSLDIITGCCNSFDVVKSVDFSFNNFGKINSETFKKFPSVEDLSLSHAGILHLEHGAFGFSAKLRNLDLSHNHLSIISSSIFYPNRNFANVHFRLNDNNWTCCCKFQVFIRHSLVHEPDQMLCRTPSQYNGLPLLELQCRAYGVIGAIGSKNRLKLPSGIPTTTGSVLDQPSTKNTFISPTNNSRITHGTFSQAPWDNSGEKNMVLKCIVCNSTICTKSEDTEYKKVRVKPRSLDFTITPLTDFSVTVGVKTTIEDPFALIWFKRATKEFFKMEINYKEYGLGCLRNISQTIIVNELTVNETYTFCLVHMEYPLTSPFNCMAYRSSYPYQAKVDVWLSQGMKNLCISLTILVILSSIVLGGSVMYCVIKKKPTLLRGSKRVIMPNKSSEDIMVLPRCGSLSKENKGVENSAFVLNRCLHLRRPSNASVDSSYVSPNLYESITVAVENKSSKKKNEIASLCSTVPPGVKRTSNDPLPSIPSEGYSELEFKDYRCSASTA